MAANPQVLGWVRNTYPSPQIDPDWLAACLEWIETDLGIPIPPAGPLQPVIDAVNSQLLQSDLSDSMLHGTGLPPNVGELNDVRLPGNDILVQITAITEIASSAFTIMNVMKAREERGIIGLDEANVAEDDDEGPIQRYPRGMLRFDLSDGSTTLKAIEYRSLPQLELGVTPLGYKMRLKRPFIRQGMAFLEPANTDLLGGSSEEREALQIRDLARSLAVRLGIYDPEDEQDAENGDENNQNQPAVAPPQWIAPPPAQDPPRQGSAPARTPFRDLSPPPLPGPSTRVHADDEEAPRRRKVPAPVPSVSTIPASSSTLVESRYFASAGSSNVTAVSTMRELAAERILSPSRTDVVIIPDSPSPPPPPSTKKTRPIAQLPARSKGKQTASQTPSSDFDFDFGDDDVALVMDDASALQELEMIEGTHSASIPAAVPPNSSSGSGSRSVGGSSRAGVAARAAPVRDDALDDSVITIDSEEEEGDKENVPVPTRHVRRRTQQRRGPLVHDEDVIDISSSD
ncbi:hypothetical protein HWV62_3468 [Athelia sp. TMB]|nr:hypothetical protein HWV62_3468 [Athelia sp. TMB]